MKIFFIVLVLLHALIHLIGFARSYQANDPFSFVSRITWLFTCGLFLLTAYMYYQKTASWWIPALLAVIISQILIIIFWQEAKWGTVLNVLVLLVAIVGIGSWIFERKTDALVEQMVDAPVPPKKLVIEEQIAHLPYPVQNWLRNCGIMGKSAIEKVQLVQEGEMRQKPESQKWIPTKAKQYFNVTEPSFLWHVDMDMMPGVPVKGRDVFSAGKGEMKILAMGWFPVSNESGPRTSQGTLQRFLAEISWFPSAALEPYITWEAIDSSSAKATMEWQGTKGSVVFYFNPAGDMVMCRAIRYMGGGEQAKLEEWEIRTIETGAPAGIRIPVRSEATWKLKAGDYTWYRLQLTSIQYR